MADVFFMRPNNAETRRMKSRLAAQTGLNLQYVELSSDIEKLKPRPGSVFIFHIGSAKEVDELVSNITTLAPRSETSVSVVISGAKDRKTRELIESLPRTIFYSAERAAHDLDILITKLIKQQALVTSERRAETLTYVQQERRTVSGGATVKSETTVMPAQAGSSNVFQPITDDTQKKLLIDDAVDSHAAVAISNFGAVDEAKGVLISLDERRSKITCELEGPPATLAAFQKQSEVSKKMAMSVALRQSRVFFVCDKFSWLSDSLIEASMPSLFYSVQRRRDFRWLCYPESRRHLRFVDDQGEATYELYDLSAGGLSVLVPEKDVARLEATNRNGGVVDIEGSAVETGPLRFRQKQSFAKAVDAGTAARGGSFFKIGFSFENIQPAARGKITQFVDRKGRDYFMDYMLASEAAARGVKK